jgi:flagellar hook assembly protein FlgD
MRLGVYPNPFNNRCIFELQLNRKSVVELVVYDMLGRKIRNIVSTELDAGQYQLEWDGRNDLRQPVGSGMYLYHLVSGKNRHTGKLLLLK